VQAQLLGRQISLLLEPYVRQQHGWRIPPSQVLFPGGLDVALAPKRSEAISVRTEEAATPIQDFDTYSVWVSQYHRFGGGGLAHRALIEPSQPYRILPVSQRDAIVDLLADPAIPLPQACSAILSRIPPENSRRRPRKPHPLAQSATTHPHFRVSHAAGAVILKKPTGHG
jgi:hypothetical protein